MPVPFPEVDGGDQLIAVAQGVGWCGQGAAGAVPVSALELTAWCAGTGEGLTQWEFATVLRMSRAFAAGTHAKVAPYQPLMIRMALATASFSGSVRL